MNELVTNLPNLDEEQLAKFREWLIGMLKIGPVTVTFNKKDGAERVMTCSLQPELLPPAPVKESTTDKKENTNIISVYDLTAQGWRSFIVKNVTNVTLKI
jgi:hypothetical protein